MYCRYLLPLLIFVLSICVGGTQGGKVVYCSPTGSDKSGNGSISNPYFSPAKAASSSSLSGGDKIQLRGGVYNTGDNVLTLHGAENNYISIEAYPGESPILDSANFKVSDATLVLQSSSYVSVSGLEIRNSNQYGAAFWTCENIIFGNNYLHNISYQVVFGTGSGIIVENNEIVFGAMANYMNPSKFANGGWPGVLMAWRGDNNAKSTNWTIRGNYIHDCWGEGIIGTFDGGSIYNNTIHDTWSVNIYLDGGIGASNLVVSSNVVYSTNTTYYRNKYPASGIEWSSEEYDFPTYPAVNILICNNLIYHTGGGFSYWHDSANTNTTSSTFSNISFINNVIWEPYASAISVAEVPQGYTQPENCKIWNNIISNNSFYVGNPDSWSVMYNDWVGGIPKTVNDTHTISANPNFVNPTISAGPAGFKLSTGSPAIGSGVFTPLVTTDFWGNPRSISHPSMGIYEPVTATPSASPATSSQSTSSQSTNSQSTSSQSTTSQSTSSQSTSSQSTSSQSTSTSPSTTGQPTSSQSTSSQSTTNSKTSGQSSIVPGLFPARITT